MRKLASWIDGFCKYVEPAGSPVLFSKWTAIFTVAAAMERKTFVKTPKGVLFPNLYTILVGPAGAGKTVASTMAHEMMQHLEDHHIASTSLTKAAMMDELNEAVRKIVIPTNDPPVIDFNSLTVIANELGVLIPAYENDFINTLTDIYDCKRYSERRRSTKNEFDLKAPQINLLAATTPSYLNNLMPEGAWDQGFISRTMMIYSGKGESVDLFEDIKLSNGLYDHLVTDLRQIGSAFGKFRFTEDAVEAFRQWMKGKEEPVPDHPKLQHYNSRRQAHLLKLCMIASASSSNELIVEVDHYVEALDWMLQAEHAMPDIFRSMVSGGSSRVMDETWHWAFEKWKKDKGTKPIPEPLIYDFISQRAPVHEVARILEVMTKTGIFVSKFVNGVGACYEVRPRR